MKEKLITYSLRVGKHDLKGESIRFLEKKKNRQSAFSAKGNSSVMCLFDHRKMAYYLRVLVKT